MATLREIEADLQALEDLLLEVGGEVTEEEAEAAIDQWLEEARETLSIKLDGYATLIHQMEARAETRKAEARRLQDLVGLDQSGVKRLKGRLTEFMDGRGVKEIQAQLHRFRLANNGGKTPLTLTRDPHEYLPAAEVHGPHPEAYEYMVVDFRWDTDKIREALDRGVDLPFARLEERGKHVRIK